MNAPYIIIEGNIGAGKTTLAKALAQRLEAHLLLEEFEENESLKDFYNAQTNTSNNPFALLTELQFLIDRNRQQQSFFGKSQAHIKGVVSDYLPQKSLLFAEMNLTKTELTLYTSVFNTLMLHLPKPNLLVYLSCESSILQENIKKRGRHYEQNISLSYLQEIECQYQKLLKQLPASLPVLILTDKDLYEKEQTDVIKKIVETLNKCD